MNLVDFGYAMRRVCKYFLLEIYKKKNICIEQYIERNIESSLFIFNEWKWKLVFLSV